MNNKSKIERFENLLQTLSEQVIDKHLDEMESLSEASTLDSYVSSCPHCKDNSNIIGWGHTKTKPRFKCKSCGKTFVHTTNTVLYHSRLSADVWAAVLSYTLDGASIDKTAEDLYLSHVTVFNMRHKILSALEEDIVNDEVVLAEVSEMDETYVLESFKGTPLPENFHRTARKHGAKASKRGLSNEQICICTAVDRQNGVVVDTVNRAKPSKEELQEVFQNHIPNDGLILTDGLKGYKVLENISSCTVKLLEAENFDSFFHLNNVNNLHSFIKKRYTDYRGVATKYLNRYNGLFSIAYKARKKISGLCQRLLYNIGDNRFLPIKEIKTRSILVL